MPRANARHAAAMRQAATGITITGISTFSVRSSSKRPVTICSRHSIASSPSPCRCRISSHAMGIIILSGRARPIPPTHSVCRPETSLASVCSTCAMANGKIGNSSHRPGFRKVRGPMPKRLEAAMVLCGGSKPAGWAELGAYFASGVGGHRIYVIPRAQLVVVHRADTYRSGPHRIGDDEVRHLVDQILRARTGPPVAKPRLIDMPEPVQVSGGHILTDTEMAALFGDYDWRRGRLTIRRDNDRLELESPRHGRFYLLPRSPSEFVIEDMEHRVEFDRGKTGEVTGLRFWTPSETMLRSRRRLRLA